MVRIFVKDFVKFDQGRNPIKNNEGIDSKMTQVENFAKAK
jgi:hypothetical protein